LVVLIAVLDALLGTAMSASNNPLRCWTALAQSEAAISVVATARSNAWRTRKFQAGTYGSMARRSAWVMAMTRVLRFASVNMRRCRPASDHALATIAPVAAAPRST
jgi:hypothetical protein